MSLGPSIALLPVPENGRTRASCQCGAAWETDSAADVAAWAGLHALRCPAFRGWALGEINNLGYALGYYMPVQVIDLLTRLVDEPAAMAVLLPWLADLEDRPEIEP